MIDSSAMMHVVMPTGACPWRRPRGSARGLKTGPWSRMVPPEYCRPTPVTPSGTKTMLHLSGRMSRLGTESAFEVLARATALQRAGRSIINLGIGQPDFPTPEHIVEAGRKALADGHHGYTPANGILPLREAVAADQHRRHGVEISPEQVLVVPGGKVTMFFAIMMFGEPGTEIIYPNPGFPIYESVICFSGATPVAMPSHESKG